MPPPPPFPSWILRGLGDEPLLIQTFDAPREPEWEILDPMFVLSYLDGWLLQPEGREILHDVFTTLFGPLEALAFPWGEEHLSLRPTLRTAFERMDLIVLVERRRNAIPPREPAPTPAPKPEPEPQKTFIEFELFEGSEPVPNEPFELELPSGATMTGTLDADGFAHVGDLDPGTCKIDFPKIDAREWGRSVMLTAAEAGASGAAIEADRTHTVLHAEDLFTIAKLHRFRNWQTIYRHEANAAFRALRPKPEILFPEDTLVIPGKRRKKEPAATGERHRFFIHPPSRFLRLRLRDAQLKPIAGEPHRLYVDGNLLSEDKSTGAQGELEEEIPLDARTGKLIARDFTWTLEIGALNPMEKTLDDGVSGAQGRLKNLGYDVGPIDGKLGPRTAEALRRFKRDHPEQGLPDDGELDRATKDALARVHGS